MQWVQCSLNPCCGYFPSAECITGIEYSLAESLETFDAIYLKLKWNWYSVFLFAKFSNPTWKEIVSRGKAPVSQDLEGRGVRFVR